MSLQQLQALSGKRVKTPYVPQINAQTPYLPQIYGQKRTQAYQDRSNQLNQSRFDLEKRLGEQGLELARKEAKDAEKARKKAQRLGYLNVGLNTGLGLAGLASSYDFGGGGSSASDAILSVPEATDILSAMGAGSSPVSSSVSAPAENLTEGFFDGNVLNKIGTGIFDFGKGLYDSTIGNIIDFI